MLKQLAYKSKGFLSLDSECDQGRGDGLYAGQPSQSNYYAGNTDDT